MNIMLMGPPGVGKGTQAERLRDSRRLTHISTGDMLRDHIARETPLGIAAREKMNAGELVPDDVMINMITARIGEGADGGAGFLLDGFPRTETQAAALDDAGIRLRAVVCLDADDDIIVARLSGRLLHKPSGRVYHRVFAPPKTPEQDDMTGEPLTQRDDDREETVRRRLAVYRRQTAPLKAFYQKAAAAGGAAYIELRGDGDIGEIAAEIARRLDAAGAQ